jgi:coenzyme PQQ biosynthesis protein B
VYDAQRLQNADVVLFDGTLWTYDELLRFGIYSKTGLRIGHISVSGTNGTIEAFNGIDVRRGILLHINNFNSILLEGIASCLTELFSSTIIAKRVDGVLANYDFITAILWAI